MANVTDIQETTFAELTDDDATQPDGVPETPAGPGG
jgi:hypothetical protein